MLFITHYIIYTFGKKEEGGRERRRKERREGGREGKIWRVAESEFFLFLNHFLIVSSC